jgi:hypothetical protein
MRKLILPITVACLAAACGKSGQSASTSKSNANAEVSSRAADSTQTAGVPTAVADVGTKGENLYDQVKAANWPSVTAIMDTLDRASAALKPSEQSQLTPTLDSLRRAIAAHQRQPALEQSNRVTLLAAKLTEPYHPTMPVDIVRLDYLGRELEIWTAQKNMVKLAETAAELRKTWDAVKPAEIAAGGTAAAAKTDSLMAQLAKAKTVSDYAKLATPILDEVDELEKPFEK